MEAGSSENDQNFKVEQTEAKQPSIKKKTKNEDLENFVDSFDSFMKVTVNLIKDKDTLCEELKFINKENERLESKGHEQEKNITDMQGIIDKLHQQLHQVCDLEDEKRELKHLMSEKENEIKELKHEKEVLDFKYQAEMEEMQNKHEQEIKKATDELQVKCDKEIKMLRDCIKEKDEQIQKLNHQVTDMERDKKSEILQLSMDFETKITKLKQKIPTTSTTTASSSSNQEIFRKKLQHMKSEYDREIILLKQTVTDLQEKLSVQNIGNNRLSLSSGKKRKY